MRSVSFGSNTTLVVSVATLVALASPALAQSAMPSDSIEAKVDHIFAKWDHVNSPGCGVAVSRNGQIVHERGYGMSNLEHAIAITPASIFHVASISKQFTAASIVLLEMDGKLSFTDDIRKYVPELPSYGKTITIDHLLHHTSGLRDQWSLLELADWREDDLITEADVLRIVSRQKALNFEPGDEYLYSNTGYTLLAVIVKRVSGKSLRQFAEERIFQPLGMTHTHFHDDHTMIVPNRTQAYQPRDSGGWSVSIPVFDTYGATSLFTTPSDLLKWEQNFGDPKVGGPSFIAKLTQTTTLNAGTAFNYARGVTVDKFRGLNAVGHSGADAGYRADVIRFPDQGLAITALCNLANINPSALTRQVAEVFLGSAMTPAASTVANNGGTHAAPAADVIAKQAGVYWNPRTEELARFVAKDGGLAIVRGQPVALTPLTDSRYAVPGQPAQFEFSTATGRPTALRIVVDGAPARAFVQTEAFAPTGAQLAAYAGRYYSEEVDAAFDFTVRNDTLVARSRRATETPLTPGAPDIFRSDIGLVRFERDARRNVTAMLVSTGRVRRLRFVRIGDAKK